MVVGGAPALVSQLVGHTNTVNNVLLVPNDNAVISVSDDRTLRVWIKRSSGDYWPSICQTLEWCVSSLALENFHLFVGLESGTINHYKITEDLNRITLLRIYNSHEMRVSSLIYDSKRDWLLSASKDKHFHWYTGETGRRLGSYLAGAACTCLAFDDISNFVFVGDFSGAIHMLKLDSGEEFKFITSLIGHAGSVKSLTWDPEKQTLISCSSDKSLFLWFIGEGKGTAIQLNFHRERVNALAYSPAERLIFSFGSDKKMAVWNLRTERNQSPLWEESDECQLCHLPFFWNVKKLWEEKNVNFKRQHHCRRCGKAVCGECSSHLSVLPCFGYEYPVRLCSPCNDNLSEEELRSSTQSHNILIDANCVDFDRSKKLLVLGSSDNVIRVYDVAACL